MRELIHTEAWRADSKSANNFHVLEESERDFSTHTHTQASEKQKEFGIIHSQKSDLT